MEFQGCRPEPQSMNQSIGGMYKNAALRKNRTQFTFMADLSDKLP